MNHDVTQNPFAIWAAIYPTHTKAKNFPPTVALSPVTSLNLLIPLLKPTAMLVDVMAAAWSNWVLRVVIAAPAALIFPFVGKTNAAADKSIDIPFPMRTITNTAVTKVDRESMSDCPDLPMVGTLLARGKVILVAAMKTESDTFRVEFATTG